MRRLALCLALVLAACGGDEAAVDAPAADPPDATADAAQVEDVPEPDAELPATPDPDPADAGEDETFVGMWAGDLPVLDDGTHFTAVPPVREKLEEAFGVEPGLLDKLSNLDEEPYFLVTPIERVGSMLGLTFPSNAKFNEDQRTLHLLVADDASHVFALLTAENGDTFYRASYDASADDLPAEAAAWMSQKGGVDFAEMVRLDDETVLSP